MSSKIDERVVSMKINAEQFKQGVAESSSALDKLKAALDLKGAEKGLQNLDAAGRNVNLAHIANGVDEISGRFTSLSVIGIGALAAIGAKAIEIGQTLVQNLGNTLTRDIQAGFSDYNTKLTSVQTIMNATGADIGTVNGYFKELDTYADKTVYNLQDMTGAFAKFTNAGVGMETSVPAIKGIANMVALAGQGANEASIAMYNLSQSIGGGFLTTTDYKSLNLANVATQEWKNNMIAGAVAAGTLRQEADGTYAIMADGSEKAATAQSLFTEELATGWASADVLLDVLGQYGDETTEIGKKALAAAQNVKSLPMMMETLAAAAGTGWTDTFEKILGNVTEATDLFSFLTREIGKFTDESSAARNAQLDLWRESGGRAALFDTQVGAIANIFKALNSVLTPLKNAFQQVFPPKMGETLTTISFAIQRFTAGLILSENAQKNLQMVATALFTVLKFGIDIIMGLFKVLGFFIGLAVDLGGAIFGLIAPVLTFVRSLLPVKEGVEESTSAVSSFFDMIVNAGKFLTGGIISGLKALGEGFDNLLNGGEAERRVKSFQEALDKTVKTVLMVYNVLAKGDFTGGGFFAEDDKFVDNLFKIREVIVRVVEALKDFKDRVVDAAQAAGSFWGAIGGGLAAAWAMVKPLADSIKQFFSDLMKGVDMDTALATVNTGVLIALAIGIGKVIKKISDSLSFVGDFKKGLIEGLDQLSGVLKSYQQNLKAEALLKIAGAIAILAGALWVLSTIDPGRLIPAVTAMATSFGILLGGLAILDKINAEPSIKASVAMALIAASMNILASAIVKIGQLNPEQLTSGLLGAAVAMGILVTAASAMSALDENDILKASIALNLMAAAILTMAGAVAIFGVMPIEMLKQGMVSVGIILGGLVVAAAALQKFAPSMVLSSVGLMAMAAALNMMLVPITALGLLPVEVIISGMILLAVVLGGMIIAAQALSKIAPQMLMASVGLIAMAFALNMMVAPIVILSALPLANLIVGIAALGLMLAVLVVATNAMTTAMPGAVAMIAVAAALLILSVALAIMGGIGLEGVVAGIIGLVAAVIAMAIISAILTPLIPVMGGLAAVMAIFAVGMLVLAAALLVGVVAIGLLGPALTLAVGGIIVFAKSAELIMASVGPMMALGAALIIFGAGAVVAGAGALVLGIGLVVLGAGLALVGAVGLIGATALLAVVKSMMKLMEHVPGMLILSGTFLALGAGVAVLGAGLLVLGAGGLLTASALMMLVPLGGLVTVSINLIIKAIERLAPMSGQINQIGTALSSLGKSVSSLADNGRQAAGGLNAISTSFTMLTAGANTARLAMQLMASAMISSISVIQSNLNNGANGFRTFVATVLATVQGLNNGVNAAFGQVQASAARLAGSVGSTLVSGVRGAYGSVYSAAVGLGGQMTAGMNAGLQNGSWSVSSMASRVAANALAAAKRTLGVASPSKEFTKIGAWSSQGLALGLYKNMSLVTRAGENVGSAALAATRDSLSQLKSAVATNMEFAPTIKPVIDLTAIRKGASEIGGLLKPPSLTVSDNYARASSLVVAQRSNTNEEGTTVTSSGDNPRSGDTYIQNINSPKAVSPSEIYRNTKNLISVTKGESPA